MPRTIEYARLIAIHPQDKKILLRQLAPSSKELHTEEGASKQNSMPLPNYELPSVVVSPSERNAIQALIRWLYVLNLPMNNEELKDIGAEIDARFLAHYFLATLLQEPSITVDHPTADFVMTPVNQIAQMRNTEQIPNTQGRYAINGAIRLGVLSGSRLQSVENEDREKTTSNTTSTSKDSHE